MNESIENIASSRERLLKLEAEGIYVFHGSENADLDSLEPRQGYNHINGVQEPDGEPAVFASNRADYAILMALINKQNCPNEYNFSAGTVNNEKGEIVLQLQATKDTLEQLTEHSLGYVYVFDKNQFTPRENRRVEYVSKVPVTSINKIRVTKKDLPPHVEMLEE